MSEPQTCSLCANTIQNTAETCPSCGARFGFRDGQGNIRGTLGFSALGLACLGIGATLLWLAGQIPIWLYWYPLVALGGTFLLGAGIIAAMLLRGPRWYPAERHP